MANLLAGTYNPILYAQKALQQLEMSLGMASRVFMGFDEERKAFGKGDTITIKRPGTFTAQDAPSTAQDITPTMINMTLANYRDVKFAVTDRQWTQGGDAFIRDHIRPAAVALANDIDTKLNELTSFVGPHVVAGASEMDLADLANAQKVMFDNNCPEDESETFFEIDGGQRAALSQIPAIAQWQGAGPQGAETQRRGALGMIHGANFFANQNIGTFTSGTSTDVAGTINDAATTIGQTTVAIDALGTGTFTAGDTFTVAGDSTVYAIEVGGTISGNALTVTISPGFVVAPADNAVVTLSHGSAAATAQRNACRFHRNAFALAMAPLPDYKNFFDGGENSKGGNYATVQDPITGLTLRMRVYLLPDSAELRVAIDCLYAVKVLDPLMACRVLQNV
jgi:hypothetical protein